MGWGARGVGRDSFVPPRASSEARAASARAREGVRAARAGPKREYAERNHQGRGNELIETPCDEPNINGPVECQERLGGVLKYYRRAA